MYTIYDDIYDKQFGAFYLCAIHNTLTRHRDNLHVLQSHLSLRQKGVHYMSVNIFSSWPEFLIDSVGDESQLTGKFQEIVIYN
jgi:hypothetical protein